MTDISQLSLAAKIRLFDRPIAFQRSFVDLGAGITGALMLSQAVYWTTRTNAEDGWFYKTIDEWQEETGLTRAEQETARKRLVKAGVLSEQRKGIPCKLYYRINIDVMLSKILGLGGSGSPGIDSLRESSKQGCEKPANKDAETKQPRKRKSRKQVSEDPASQPAGKTASITETTQETTAETTADTLSGQGADAPSPALEGEYLAGAIEQDPPPEEDTKRRAAYERYLREASGPKDPECKTYRAWVNYAICYEKTYGVWPLWNQTAAGQMSKFIDKVGADEAPKLSAHYLKLKDRAYLQSSHDVSLLLRDAQAIYTACLTGRAMNGTIARQMEANEANLSAAAQVRAQGSEGGRPNAFIR